MTKNEILKKFIQNPKVRENINVSDGQLNKMDLYTSSSDKLLEVIKTTILYTESENAVESTARKINQYLKKPIA